MSRESLTSVVVAVSQTLWFEQSHSATLRPAFLCLVRWCGLPLTLTGYFFFSAVEENTVADHRSRPGRLQLPRQRIS